MVAGLDRKAPRLKNVALLFEVGIRFAFREAEDIQEEPGEVLEVGGGPTRVS